MEGSARTMRSLKEFVPMSAAAKRSFAILDEAEAADCGRRRFVDICSGDQRRI